MLLQPLAELMRAAVEGVCCHPPRWDARLESPLEHPLGQLDLVRKSHLLGNASLGPALWVVRPLLGQIQRSSDEGGTLLGGVAQKHPDLAVDCVACGARVLAANTYTLLALLQEAGLVGDEHPTLFVAQVLNDILPEVVAHEVGVPLGRVQEPLDALRVRFSDGLGQLPAVLALHPPEQAEQVALHSLSGFRTGKATGDTLLQVF